MVWLIRKRKRIVWSGWRGWTYLTYTKLGWTDGSNNSAHMRFTNQRDAQKALDELHKKPEFEYMVYQK